ncbi:MAG: DUF3892 domain-containing protein [Actinomycetota bacterium]|nr:DUF3892 domain-containing protein [Actinomycetota bacterium]
MPSGPKYIERIHLTQDGYRHEHIQEVEYRYGPTGDLDHATTGIMALLIDEHSWDVRVKHAQGAVKVDTVHPYGRPPYLRAVADGTPTDNLLDLPKY